MINTAKRLVLSDIIMANPTRNVKLTDSTWAG
jgi:hypothetical protein